MTNTIEGTEGIAKSMIRLYGWQRALEHALTNEANGRWKHRSKEREEHWAAVTAAIRSKKAD
jgi:hypothetical protein